MSDNTPGVVRGRAVGGVGEVAWGRRLREYSSLIMCDENEIKTQEWLVKGLEMCVRR